MRSGEKGRESNTAQPGRAGLGPLFSFWISASTGWAWAWIHHLERQHLSKSQRFSHLVLGRAVSFFPEISFVTWYQFSWTLQHIALVESLLLTIGVLLSF